jgi:hypothetical protein
MGATVLIAFASGDSVGLMRRIEGRGAGKGQLSLEDAIGLRPKALARAPRASDWTDRLSQRRHGNTALGLRRVRAAPDFVRRDIHPCLAAQQAGLDPTEGRCVNLWWDRRVGSSEPAGERGQL